MMIEYLVLFVLGFALGHKLSTLFHVHSFKRILEELGVTREQMLKLAAKNGLEVEKDEGPEKDELETIHIKLEKHQNQIYAFRTDNDQFLGQGADREQLIDALKARMTKVRLIIDEGGDLIKSKAS